MKYGLALSGGGARGVVHLGVIKALEELGIEISVIAGTSAGSIVGSLYAYGHSPEEIFKIINTTSFFKSVRPAWTWAGLLRLDGLRDALLKQMPENSFDVLKRGLIVAATDLVKGKPAYFTEGELIPAILASSCVPGIFSPVEFNGSYYVDGGLMDNFPVSVLVEQCDFIIGSHCNPIADGFDKRNLKAIVERSLLLAINGNTSNSKKLCNVFIEAPGMGNISGFELARAEDMFLIGYEYTIKNFKREDFA